MKSYMSNVKVTIIRLIVLIKKVLLYKMSYFPEPYTHSRNKRKVELNLPNYATKSDLKGITGINTSKFAKEVDLANLKSNIDKLDIAKLETTPVDLSKLNDIVKIQYVMYWLKS